MNLKNAALLLCEDLTTVKVRPGAWVREQDSKESDCQLNTPHRIGLYTYLVTRTLAAELKQGDKVSVQGKKLGSLSYATVEYVDQDADIEVDSDTEYKWVFCKVPVADIDYYQQRVDGLYYRIAEKQRVNARTQMLYALGLNGTETLTLGTPPARPKTAEQLAADTERAAGKF